MQGPDNQPAVPGEVRLLIYQFIQTKELLMKITKLNQAERRLLEVGAEMTSRGRNLRIKLSAHVSKYGNPNNPYMDNFHSEYWVRLTGKEQLAVTEASGMNSTLY